MSAGHYNFECTISDVDWEDDQKASAKIQCLLEDILTNANYAAECAGQVLSSCTCWILFPVTILDHFMLMTLL